MSWSEFTALLLLATAVSFTPGPNTTLSAAMGAQGGMRHALPFVCAVPVGWGLLLTLSTLGVGAIIMQTTHAKLVIAVLGAGYLVWLAKRLLGVKPAPATSQALPQDTVRVGFLAGIGLQFVNIKAWMLALSIVAGWLTGQQQLLAICNCFTGDDGLRLLKQPAIRLDRRSASGLVAKRSTPALV